MRRMKVEQCHFKKNGLNLALSFKVTDQIQYSIKKDFQKSGTVKHKLFLKPFVKVILKNTLSTKRMKEKEFAGTSSSTMFIFQPEHNIQKEKKNLLPRFFHIVWQIYSFGIPNVVLLQLPTYQVPILYVGRQYGYGSVALLSHNTLK